MQEEQASSGEALSHLKYIQHTARAISVASAPPRNPSPTAQHVANSAQQNQADAPAPDSAPTIPCSTTQLQPFSDRSTSQNLNVMSPELPAFDGCGPTDLSHALFAAAPVLHTQLLGSSLPLILEAPPSFSTPGAENSLASMLSTESQFLAQPAGHTSHARFLFNPPPGYVQPVRHITSSLHRQQQTTQPANSKRPASARNADTNDERAAEGAIRRRPSSASAVPSHRDQAVLAGPEWPQEQRASHIIAPFAIPKGIPRGFGGIQHRVASELHQVQENEIHPRPSRARAGHPPTYPQLHGTDQRTEGHYSLQVDTKSPIPRRRHEDGSCDRTSKVSTYEMHLGEDTQELVAGQWVHATRLSVANPQKGFRNR